MFTLRIIFYGLIALVTDGRQEGALALLVNELSHAPSVWMMEGDCIQGSCYRFPGQPGMTEILSQTYRQNGFRLAWFLNKEHLSLGQMAGPDWDQRPAPVFDDGVPAFPASLGEAQDLIWVPKLLEIAPSVGDLREDCLDVPQACPVAARFEASRGVVSSCHLVHEGNGETSEVHAFDFRISESANPVTEPRAIADAVMVEVLVEGNGVKLFSKPFTADAVQNSADLVPQQGRITLIVSNNDYSGNGRHDHFEHYYHLMKNDTALTAKPLPHPRTKQRLSPGSCEEILNAFETALGVAVIDGVHDHRECDMVQIQHPGT